MQKEYLKPAARSPMDALEILLIVFTLSSLAVIQPNISQFCKCLSTFLTFH